MIVLTLNSGSSSLKFGLYRTNGPAVTALATGMSDGRVLRAVDGGGATIATPSPDDATPEAAVRAIAMLLADAGLPPPQAIGHRIVHGGPRLLTHCLIDPDVERRLEEATALSPLHAPVALSIVRQAANLWPDRPQAACLDTAFHAGLPDIARTLPLPAALRERGLRRYGFHGLSCESIVRQLGGDAAGRVIVAHLGSGASVTAMRDGRSVDTSMGLTPSGGVMMATRSGDLDPGILLHLARVHGLDAAALEDLLDHRAGLLGVSGSSADMRDLQAMEADPAARLAVAMFCRSVAKAIAGMIVALGGLDTLVFTGGIGEHAGPVRAAILHDLAWAGIADEEGVSAAGQGRASVRTRVLPSREDEQIARHTADLIPDWGSAPIRTL